MQLSENNIILMTDSYKVSHWKQYPPKTEFVYSYFESRGGEFSGSVFFGLQYLLKKYFVGQVVTKEKIQEAKEFYQQHFGCDLFNEEGWQYIIDKYNGYLPVKIKAVPEGSVLPIKNVLITVENTDPNCYWLTNYVETILVQIWYPTTITTNSRECKKIINHYLEETGDPSGLLFKLHDFGYRGVSSNETAMIGGASHLVNFLGTDTVAGIVMANNYYNAGICGYSIPACYDDQTEILTNKGFKLFSQLKETDLVAEYKNNGTIDFVEPITIHKYQYNGDLYHFTSKSPVKKVDLMVTPNHRMVYKSKYNNKINIKEAENFKYTHRNMVIQSGITNIHSNRLSMEERLLIAFQADGSYPSREEQYDGSRCGTIPIRFSLDKERKIERLEWILKELDLEYSKSEEYKDGKRAFWIKCHKKYSKIFDWIDLNSVSSEWTKDFIEELQYWDGNAPSKNTINYSSTIKYNVDIVQALGTICGYRPHFNEYNDKRTDCNRNTIYTCLLLKDKTTIGGESIKKEQIQYNGTVYCVTVSSGMIIVRRNNRVSISGNSEHSTITSWSKENEVDAMRNMLQQYPNGLVACVSDSFDIYNACRKIWGEQLKDQILHREGTLVIRPDSGNPTEVIPKILFILWDKFGGTINSKGYRVLDSHVRLIQGDGINYKMLEKILETMKENGFSADNIAFGSGGGLLQQFNRDTMSFAFKCSSITIDGKNYDVYKDPVTSKAKVSKKGRLKLINDNGMYKTVNENQPGKDLLVTIFENGILLVDYNFDEIRERVKL